MSKKTSYAVDNNGAMVAAGLVALIGTVVGVGLWRRGGTGRGKVLETADYRGAKYRIEEWPIASSVGFVGVVPAQSIGAVQLASDEAALVGSLDEARRYVKQLIDSRLGAAA